MAQHFEGYHTLIVVPGGLIGLEHFEYIIENVQKMVSRINWSIDVNRLTFDDLNRSANNLSTV